MDYKQVTQCRICGSEKLTPYLDMGELPLANGLMHTRDEQYNLYPLKVLFCEDCHLSQLSTVVNPKVLYTNYPYRSYISRTFNWHTFYLGKTLFDMHKDKYISRGCDPFDVPDPTVIDIGANDGTLLHQFKRSGFIRMTGIEPDESLRDYVDKDVNVLNIFWSDKTIAPLKRLLSLTPVDFITAVNVFAHSDDVHGFLKGVVDMLKPCGTFVLEVPYAYDMIKNCEFDTIYHEHLSYFLLKPLVQLFKMNKLNIYKVEKYPIHGGTIRVYTCKDERPVDSSVGRMLEMEKAGGMYELKTYKNFAMNILSIKSYLLDALRKASSNNAKVIGFGASAKGCTLLNYFKIDCLDYIIDDTPVKQDKWVPGCKVQVKGYDYHEMKSVDYILLLAWNFKDEIMKKINATGYTGKWIIPIPKVQVV